MPRAAVPFITNIPRLYIFLSASASYASYASSSSDAGADLIQPTS